MRAHYHPKLEADVRKSLEVTAPCHARVAGEVPTAEEIFRQGMQDVILGIERHAHYGNLKRFIVHGCLLPSWEKKFQDSPQALDDMELATCVDFIGGHMVSKFQGKLGEMLAATAIRDLMEKLVAEGKLPKGSRLICGESIRCARSTESGPNPSGGPVALVQGPDAVVLREADGGSVEIAAVAEIKADKSTYPSKFRRQCAGHVRALGRGCAIQGRWFSAGQIQWAHGEGGSPLRIVRIFARPSRWRLTRRYSLYKDSGGVGQITMEEQELPAVSTDVSAIGEGEWLIRLAWSYDALRAAAFVLMHAYMGGLGLELSSDLAQGIRTDMSPYEAGQNDFLAQLNVAIARQDEMEKNQEAKEKTIELYNVLDFGWALGHRFRDKDGNIAMLEYQDLVKRAATAESGG